MRQFYTILRFFKKPHKMELGRWSMNYEKHNLDRKIYLANHDNCGPCGNFIIPKKESYSITKSVLGNKK